MYTKNQIIQDYCLQIQKKMQAELFIYDADLFDQRLKEEKIRTDAFLSKFVILEVIWKSFISPETEDDQLKKLLTVFLKTLNQFSRGSDIKGFSENQLGMNILLLDCDLPAAHRIVRRISDELKQKGLSLYVSERAFLETFECTLYDGQTQEFKFSKE